MNIRGSGEDHEEEVGGPRSTLSNWGQHLLAHASEGPRRLNKNKKPGTFFALRGLAYDMTLRSKEWCQRESGVACVKQS